MKRGWPVTHIDFSHRNNLSEFMDSDATDFETFRACLVDLSNVNRLTLAYRPTMQFFRALAQFGRLTPERAISVVDVGSGYGDMMRRIDRWAERCGLKIELTGVDMNPWSAHAASEVTPSNRPIRFITRNIFDYRPEQPVDVVISSLLTHHLDDDSLVRFIRWMESNTAIGWFVNDLYRNAIPYHLFRLATRLLGFHEFVQHDGPISIARAFDVADWRRLLASAGLAPGAAKISPVFPYRLCVARLKTR